MFRSSKDVVLAYTPKVGQKSGLWGFVDFETVDGARRAVSELRSRQDAGELVHVPPKRTTGVCIFEILDGHLVPL